MNSYPPSPSRQTDLSVSKRIFDIVVSIIMIIVCAPVMLLVAGMVRFKIGSPIFFIQKRPGLNGKPFRIFKLRTMTDARDEEGNLLPDAERLTPFGRFLRSTSLDELPELINVLKGEMSLVGPRPLLMEYLERYTPEQMRRHEVLPGITGWAQVNGRNALSWEEKFEMDIWYVDHQSFWLDIKILFFTMGKILKRDNISHEGEATMSKYMGSGYDA